MPTGFVPCLTGLSDGARRMKVRLNENEEIVRTVKEGLKAKGGYCPCRVGKSEDIKCPCLEFRSQIADPDFEGYCHCMLYYKEKRRTAVLRNSRGTADFCRLFRA